MLNPTRRWTAGFLSFGGGLALVALLFPGFLTGLPGQSATADITADMSDQICNHMYYALDPADPTKPNPNKETTGSFGTPVTQRGEVDVKAELKERRSCGVDGSLDPALTAAHYSEWSHYGLTSVKVGDSTAEINAFAARIKADPDLYATTLAELEKLEGESTYSEAAVMPGVWSLYMTPDGKGGVTIKVGQTSTVGVNAVFTHGDVVVKYRLDCGFQPNRDEGFPGIDVCTENECAPPPVCPPGQVGTPPYDCYTPKFETPTTYEPGWDQRGRDNGLTDGQESARQIESGETRGNAVNDQVPGNTGNHTTTPDTIPSDQGGPVAPGAGTGGDNRGDDVQDDDLVVDDDKGTGGAVCTPTPLVSC